MDASNASTDAKGVELTEEHATPTETEKVTESVDVRITFCTHVGWDGVLVILFLCWALLVCLVMSPINTPRILTTFIEPGVWVFMVMELLFVLVVFYK